MTFSNINSQPVLFIVCLLNVTMEQFYALADISGVPRNFSGGGGSTNSVEDRGPREWGSEGGSPLVSGSTQFAIE
jgi:hypothetical protein